MSALLPKDLLADLESEDRTELHLKETIAPPLKKMDGFLRTMVLADSQMINNQFARIGGAMSGGLLRSGLSAQEQSAFSSLSGLANQQQSAFNSMNFQNANITQRPDR